MLMAKYPIIVVIGAAVLGKVAGEMMVTDPWIQRTFAIPHWFVYTVEATFAIGVVVVGKLIMKRKKARLEAAGEVTPADAGARTGKDARRNEINPPAGQIPPFPILQVRPSVETRTAVSFYRKLRHNGCYV